MCVIVTFAVHTVPRGCDLLQIIFDKASEMLGLKKDKQLVYKGGSVSQACDRIRLEVMRPSRRQWTEKEFTLCFQGKATHVNAV